MSMVGKYVRVSPGELAELRAAPESIVSFLYPDDLTPPPNHLDVDKAWHAIHFLLNGRTWDGEPPLFDAVLGGRALSEIDVGYGPARFLEPYEVRVLADALGDVLPEELLKRFDPLVLNEAEIYPHGWSGEQCEREYVASNYQRLVEFFREAANAGEAIIEYLN